MTYVLLTTLIYYDSIMIHYMEGIGYSEIDLLDYSTLFVHVLIPPSFYLEVSYQ